MTKKLYTVSIEAEIVVVAESEADAEEYAQDAMRDMSSYDYGFTVRDMRFMPDGWDGTDVPFGDRDDAEPDRTVDGWIKAGAGETYLKARAEWDARVAKAAARATKGERQATPCASADQPKGDE